MKKKIFFYNIATIFDDWFTLSLALGLGIVMGILIDQRRLALTIPELFIDLGVGLFLGLLFFEVYVAGELVWNRGKAIITSIKTRQPIRNQPEDELLHFQRQIIFQSLSELDLGSIDCIYKKLFEVHND